MFYVVYDGLPIPTKILACICQTIQFFLKFEKEKDQIYYIINVFNLWKHTV